MGPKFWTLYDKKENHYVRKLTLEDVLVVIKSIAPHNYSRWMCRDSEASDWQEITAIREFGLKQIQPEKKFASVGPTGRRPLLESFDGQDDDEITLEFDVEELEDKRRSRRFRKVYEVTIVDGDKIFSSQTVDISLKGLLINDPLPDWVKSPFDLTLEREGVKIKAQCSAASEKPIYKIRIKKTNAPDLLRQWLLT